ncbi:hypothetical protein CRG98_036383 [Punica granatum]|uniref:Uncharacterized protein n=1 Tax=Punica granatum TaxID=22663 RepID=A0A2I0IIS0_PUNGR|nr:hypothetical protein CRG98_036383 [Punica granatum]
MRSPESSKVTRPKPEEIVRSLGRSPKEAVKWTRSPRMRSPESSKVTRPKPEESGKMDAKSADAKSGKQ